MPRTHLRAVALVLVVVLAGCGGAVDDPTTTAAASDTDATTAADPATPPSTTGDGTTIAGGTPIAVQNGDLPVDAGRVFDRVQSLLGTDVRPQSVTVRNLTERKGYAPGEVPFLAAMGVENVTLNRSAPGGLTRASGAVYVHPGEGSPVAIERVLAHEFVHVAQYRAPMLPWLSELDPPRATMDWVQTQLALVEGGAVFATDAYLRAHRPNATSQSERVARMYERGPTGDRLFFARYHFGSRYVAAQIDDADRLSQVYESYPRTTEQVLHNLTPSAEPPARLAVSVDDESDVWRAGNANNTVGELFLRVALRGELDRTEARSAAAGWGNDRLYGFTAGSADRSPGFAWTLRWDTAADAEAFAGAFERFADARRTNDRAFRTERVASETVVVFAGDPGFVGDASASGTVGNVTVSVGE